MPHFEEDDELSAVDATAAAASIGVTDPSVVLDPDAIAAEEATEETAPAEAGATPEPVASRPSNPSADGA